jgi:hypothetical protein
MPVGTAGANASLLQSIGTAWRGRTPAPVVSVGRKSFGFTANGDAAAVSFNIPHGMQTKNGTAVAPSGYILEPRNAVSAAAHYVSAVNATNIVVTFASAPASGTNNVTFLVTVYK